MYSQMLIIIFFNLNENENNVMLVTESGNCHHL